MTFGRLIYGTNPYLGKHQLVNIGDFFQTFAIDSLLCDYGIAPDDLVNVQRDRIKDYENLVLPMVGVFTHMRGKEAFPLPASVKPLFFGYHNLSSVSKAELLVYQKAGFVGCRDEATANRLKKKGINAYLVGCATLALDARKQAPKSPKIFLVDIPPKLERFIPAELKKDAVRLTNEVSLSKKDMPDSLRAYEDQAKKMLERYKSEAGLVITSRLHCAAPCLALGIPVILAREYFDERYSFIDKFLPLYTPDRFGEIDWSPRVPDLTEVKRMLKTAFFAMVSGSPDTQSALEALDRFYMQRDRAPYRTPVKTRVFYFGLRFFPYATTMLRNKWLKRFTVLGKNR